jgi:hypothetical protein
MTVVIPHVIPLHVDINFNFILLGRFFDRNSPKVGTSNTAPAIVVFAGVGLFNTVSLQKSTSNNSMELFAQKDCYIFRLR